MLTIKCEGYSTELYKYVGKNTDEETKEIANKIWDRLAKDPKTKGLMGILPDGSVVMPKKDIEKTYAVHVVYGFKDEARNKLLAAKQSGKKPPLYPYRVNTLLAAGTEILVDAAGTFQPATVYNCAEVEKSTIDKVVGNGHRVKPVLRVLSIPA